MDTMGITLKSLGNIVISIVDDQITVQCIDAMGCKMDAVQALGRCLRRCAYHSQPETDDIRLVRHLRHALLGCDDWDRLAGLDIAPALAHTADALFERRRECVHINALQ